MSRIFEPEYMTEKNRIYSLQEVEDAIENSDILESMAVSCTEDKTVILNIGEGITGYINFQDIEFRIDGLDVKPISAISRVGRHVKYIPISIRNIDEGKYEVMCSRKLAQEICNDKYISRLMPGDIIDAKIVKIEKYGVFCDIGCGIVALLPTNYISVTHIVDPKELLSSVKKLKVVVRQIQEDGKIQLTHKELLGTWDEEISKFKEGQTVCGAIISIKEYGVFVRISQNLSGLANIPTDMEVKPGDIVSVHISNITRENMKVKLHIIDKISNNSEQLSFKYYVEEPHIDKWVYTSKDSKSTKRQIETDFTLFMDMEGLR